jgi:hypothetical protein
LTDAAFLMLRKAIGSLDTGTGIRLAASDIVLAAELVEAEYAVVRDADDRLELRATPAGIEYMKMIEALLGASVADSIVNSEIPEQYQWSSGRGERLRRAPGRGPFKRGGVMAKERSRLGGDAIVGPVKIGDLEISVLSNVGEFALEREPGENDREYEEAQAAFSAVFAAALTKG